MASTFSATVAYTGTPNFGLIHIDPKQTAAALQTYLDTASKLTGVSLDDISTGVVTMPTTPSSATLVDLLGAGMKLFDAMVWLTAGRPKSHPLKIDPGMKSTDVPTLHNVARSVFYCYFMLVTQARYPASQSASDPPKIPNFLRTIMGMDEPQHLYVARICSFEPQKFDPAWAKHVRFDGFGQEVLSRFGLGVAGYRMFAPFKLYDVKRDIDPALAGAATFARTVARAPPSWNIHPLTRNPAVLTNRGNLNKNLGNLILDAFTDEQIKEMVTARVLYKYPDREPAHTNYKQWDAGDDISGGQSVF